MINKFVLIDKPKDYTSRDICNILQKKLNIKKIGHSGTLDPFATGLLIIGLNNATKAFDYLPKYKTYSGEVEIGYTTDTLDITGKIIKKSNKDLNIEELKKIIDNNFKNKVYSQRIPDYSAAKLNGLKRYELARKKVELPNKYKEVQIKDFLINQISDKKFNFKVTVSTGTYIRQLTNDLTKILGMESTLIKLRRESIGSIDVQKANKVTDKNLTMIDLTSLVNLKILNLDANNYEPLILGKIINYPTKNNENLFFSKFDKERYAIIEKVDIDKLKIKRLINDRK